MKDEFKIAWKNKRGKSFEDLVYELLKCMFPNIVFKQTDYIHDGGKDFYSVGNAIEEKIWVEAKNYNNHLELSKFSNTFIMADIAEVNRILIFSMSEVTSGAQTNIARYAAYNNKSISVYAGKDICFLLKKYKNDIVVDDYIENANELFCMIFNYEEPVSAVRATHEYYRAKQFNLAYRRNKENYMKQNELANLPLHSLVAQEIHITNTDLFQAKKIKLDFSEYHNSNIESYFYKAEPKYIEIPPASTHIIVVFFKFATNCQKADLPSVHFDSSEVAVESEPCQTECCWLGEIPYMGNGWEQLQNTIYILSINLSKKAVIIEGKSGVGKTRFLTELSGYFFQNGYRIICLDFRSLTELSLKSILQNILNNIYVLDDENKESVTYIESFGEKYKDFYDIMYNDSYNFTANIDKLSMLFLWLFQKKQILLSIDNVQDINADAVVFFERLLSDINNQIDILSVIVFCFNIDFLYQEKASYRLLSYAKQLGTVHSVKLKDFSIDDARSYLSECLDPRGLRSDLYRYFDTIIERFGTNPFILKQLIIYLKQRDIITFVDSMVCVTDFANMKVVLSELPSGINQIIHYRYACLLNNIQSISLIHVNRIIWSILFLGKLKTTWISKIHIKVEGIRALLNYGFVEYNSKSEIVFCHQLIEKSFCLFFSKAKYVKHPALVFIEDKKFLKDLFKFTSHAGKINLCVENMLLGVYMNMMDETCLHLALKKLSHSSPRAIMLPLIADSLLECLNSGLCTQPALEFQALYSISIACQERFDVHMASEYMNELVIYEQETYKEKLSARSDMIMFFKNNVFQVSIEKKYIFLKWLIAESMNFGLSDQELQSFLGWIYNRYSKNLCSEHRFDEAKVYIQKALKIALAGKDYSAASEAEIEFGNIYAYFDAERTAEHWKKCVQYIEKSNTQSVYFKIYNYGYNILSKLLHCEMSVELTNGIEHLLELRDQTFLYQKLFIDDIYADYYIIRYLDGECSFEEFKKMVPKLVQAKSESYMHTPIFTILTTYKLFTVYRLISDVEPTDANIDTTTALAYELIKSNIFDEPKLQYSTMILYEIYAFCQNKGNLTEMVSNELPQAAKNIFYNMQNGELKEQFGHAITPLSNKNRQVNLLHFNYVF